MDSLLELAIVPPSADRERIEAAAKYIAASMGLGLHDEAEVGQLILGGCSESALYAALAMLRYVAGDGLDAGSVQVACRESVKESADADYTHKKQSTGAWEFARVILNVAPGPSSGVQFRNDSAESNLPTEYADAVERGAREAARTGSLGMPLTAIEIRLKDGVYHDIDSSPFAFEQAARCAVVEAIRRAGVRLMEPLATAAVLTHERYLTAITGELERRNTSIARVKMHPSTVIVASGKMSDLLGLEGALESISAGGALATFMLSGYVEVPPYEVPPDKTPAAAALRA